MLHLAVHSNFKPPLLLASAKFSMTKGCESGCISNLTSTEACKFGMDDTLTSLSMIEKR